MELRYLLAYTVWNYELSYAPGEEGRRMEEESVDLVILKAGSWMLCLRRGRGWVCDLFLCAERGHRVRSWMSDTFLAGRFHSKKACVLPFSHKT